MSTAIDPSRRYATLTFVRGALVSLVIAIFGGMLGVLFYVPDAVSSLQKAGIDFTVVRPIHTTFTSAWIFLGGIAVVHYYLENNAGAMGKLEKRLLSLQLLLWAFAGGGILVSLLRGVSSGREYMGFHPLLSIPIFVGWLCFAFNFFRATGRGFMGRPVYISMWGVGVLFFMYTFLEQHAWLIPGVFAEPVIDTRIQWKACGTLVGSFNLFVYGSLYYIGERVSGDENYARSRLAYALFGVGLINSFTNFAHHTYHLPQSVAVKWVSFVISMIEIILLYRVVLDLSRSVGKKTAGSFNSTRFYMSATKWWTGAILASAILLSIPPLNALIHGTHVVTGHAMGSEIGIDTMALFAAVAWLLGRQLAFRGLNPQILNSTAHHVSAIGFNIASAVLVIWLHISGSIVGYTRYLHELPPEWLVRWNPIVFAVAGFATAGFLLSALVRWGCIAFAPARDPSRVTTTPTLKIGRADSASAP